MTLAVRVLAFRAGAEDVELGPDGAPKAFRIWRAGENPTDHGVHSFTDKSARLLMREQAMRGNVYSIDVDHMSLDRRAPPENHKAVGFHRLEVRNGELWAVDVQWTDSVRAGLTKDPPEWRFFSPAYDTTKSGEIVSYLNTALTNNPATWQVTALANRRGQPMKFSQIMAALLGSETKRIEATRFLAAAKYESILADLMGDDEEKKSKAIAALAAAFPDDGDGDEDGGKKKEEKKEKKAAEEEPKEKATKAAEEEPKEKDSKAAAVAATRELAVTVAAQGKEIEEFRAERLERQRAEVLAKRPDLPEKLVATLRKMPIDLMQSTIDGIPAPKEDPAAATRVTATRGAGRDGAAGGEGYGAQRAARLPPAEHAELAARFGRETDRKGIHWHPERPSDLVFPILNREEARRMLAARISGGKDGPPRRPEDRKQGGAQ